MNLLRWLSVLLGALVIGGIAAAASRQVPSDISILVLSCNGKVEPVEIGVQDEVHSVALTYPANWIMRRADQALYVKGALPSGAYRIYLTSADCGTQKIVVVLPGLSRHLVYHLEPKRPGELDVGMNAFPCRPVSLAGRLPYEGLSVGRFISDRFVPAVVEGKAYYFDYGCPDTWVIEVQGAYSQAHGPSTYIDFKVNVEKVNTIRDITLKDFINWHGGVR